MSATQHAWPLDRLGAALSALAESHGLIGEPGGASFMLADPLRETDDQAAIGAWLEHRAALLGAELEPTYVEVGELAHSLPRLGPAILLIRNEGEPTRALALLPSSGSSVRVLGPDLKAHRIRVDVVARALAESRLATRRAECESVLAAVNIPERRRVAATEALLQRRCANLAVQGIWQLRLPPSAPLGAQLRRDGAARSLTISIIAHLAHYLLLLGAWWVIGRSILQGRSDLGWLIAWALLLLSIVPLRALQSWHTGLTALRVGAIIKRRLLAGALALEPDEIRTRGIGRLLALVIESSAVESLAISTGFASVSAIVDLTMAAWVLGQGAGGPLLALAMWVWLLLVGVLGWRYAVQRFAWARRRLDMTHALVERMVGHTTRLAQEPPSRWHEGEDAATSAYLGSSRAMDRLAVMLRATATRGWILVAVIGLWPVLVGGATSTTTLAIALGGVLLAQTAFVRFAGGVVDLVDLMVAWGEVRSLSATAARGQGLRSRFFRPKPEAGQRPSDPDAQPVIEARELGYRYPRPRAPGLARMRSANRVRRAPAARGPLRRRQVDARCSAHRPARARYRIAAARRPRSPDPR